jgi:hypothetical protein
MGRLFDVESNTITYHLQEIFRSEELEEDSTTRIFRVVQNEGDRSVRREILFYNLDAIIAVGYRVNSKSATRFRQWATRTLHDYIMIGKTEANTVHREVGKKVRQTIKELGGTMPENLPTPDKSIRQVERKHREELSSEEGQ